MNNELRENEELLDEYEEAFDDEERLSHALKFTKDNFSINVLYVKFEELFFTEPIKTSRKETYLGLTKSVQEVGILTPIHVMKTESFSDWESEGSSGEYDGIKYILVNGFRRVYAGLKTGLEGCLAVVFDFKDKDKGSQLITAISCIINRYQKRSWTEVWYLYKIFEMQSTMSPSTLEYLLGLEGGEAMKLKDIMLGDYPEVRDELLSGKKDITQAYNMLQKLRRDEDTLAMDDERSISEVDASGQLVDSRGKAILSSDEVKDILEMLDDFDGDLSEEDFADISGENLPPERFDVNGDRHLDPALRAAILKRDNYSCQVSGFGSDQGLPVEIALGVLQIHHKLPVSLGGTNDKDNLLTISQNMHTLVHIAIRTGKLAITKEEFSALSDDLQVQMKKVMKLARIAIEAQKRLDGKRTPAKGSDPGSQWKMPGADLAENKKALGMG